MANVTTNLETGVISGKDTTTSRALRVEKDGLNQPVLLMGQSAGPAFVVLSGVPKSFRITTTSNNNGVAIFLISNRNSGLSALLHVGYTNAASIVSQLGSEFITSGTPTTSQTKVTFSNAGSTVTVEHGNASSRDYVITILSNTMVV